jgi:hypothetical protein
MAGDSTNVAVYVAGGGVTTAANSATSVSAPLIGVTEVDEALPL